jgi:hypothetical protein
MLSANRRSTSAAHLRRIIGAFELHFHVALQMRDHAIISIIIITITIMHRHALPWTSVD